MNKQMLQAEKSVYAEAQMTSLKPVVHIVTAVL